MSELSDWHDNLSDPLPLDRCPDCGYHLRGLPARHVCPECGFGYDPEMIVLYGRRGMLTVEYGLTPPPSLPGSNALGMLGFVALAVLTLGLGFRGVVMVLALALLVTFVWGGYFIWRRNVLRDAPDVIQLRLCRQGFAQRYGVGRVRLHAWSRRHCVHITTPKFRPGGRLEWCNCRIQYRGFAWTPPELAFLSRPETIAHIRQRLCDWGVQSDEDSI